MVELLRASSSSSSSSGYSSNTSIFSSSGSSSSSPSSSGVGGGRRSKTSRSSLSSSSNDPHLSSNHISSSRSGKMIPMLRYFSLYLLFLAFSAQSANSHTANAKHQKLQMPVGYYAAIYFGDSEVDIGDEFKITCRIAITEPVQWIKDGEVLVTGSRRHHSKDDYVFSTEEAEGNEFIQLSRISSLHAQPHHEGKYRCNALHPTSHRLHVRKAPHKPHNNSGTHHKTGHVSHTPKTTTAHDELALSAGAADNDDEAEDANHDSPNNNVQILDDPPVDFMTTLIHNRPVSGIVGHHRQQLQKQQDQHSVGGGVSGSGSFKHNDMTRLVDHVPNASGEVAPTEIYRPLKADKPHTPVPASKDAAYDEVVQESPTDNTANTAAETEDEAAAESNESSNTDEHIIDEAGAEWTNPVYRNSSLSPEFEHFPVVTDSAMVVVSVLPPKHTHTHHQHHLLHLPLNLTEACRVCLRQNSGTGTGNVIASGEVTGPEIERKYEQMIEGSTTAMRPLATASLLTTASPAIIATGPTLTQVQSGHKMLTRPPRPTEVPAVVVDGDGTKSLATGDTKEHLKQLQQPGSAELVANYDNAERQMKVFDDRVRKALTLSCNSSNHGLSWTRNGVPVAEDPQLKNRYELKHTENAFVIAQPDEKDAGNYTCSLSTGESKDFNVVANVYLKNMADNMAVVEGEKLRIHCIAFGTDPKIYWSVGNINVSESTDDRVKLSADENGIENAVLTIESTVLEDRAFYNCSAINDAVLYGNAKYTVSVEITYVRVKGKLAALWPFLGICAEVFILCAIILVYEKRRNKAEMDESDTDQSPEQEKLKEKK